MWILVSGATATVRRLLSVHQNLGVLLTPADGNRIPDADVTWAADNSAYSGFNERKYRTFLKRLRGAIGCRWITAPDVVADSVATLSLYQQWQPIITDHGLLPALVAQDGLSYRQVPWLDVSAVFIGGTTKYKLSLEAAEIVREANARCLWTHMGRVNSVRRVLYAAAIGCRSIDGSSFSRYSRIHLPWALRVACQLPLHLSAQG